MIGRGSEDSYTPETFREIHELEEQLGQRWFEFMELVGSGEYDLTRPEPVHFKWQTGSISSPILGDIDRAYVTERTADRSHQVGVYDLDRRQGFVRVVERGEEYYVGQDSSQIEIWGAWVIDAYLSADTPKGEKAIAKALCEPALTDFPLRVITPEERKVIYQRLTLSQISRQDFQAILECYYQAAFIRQGQVDDDGYFHKMITERADEHYQKIATGESLALRFGSKYFSSTKLELHPNSRDDTLTTYLYLNNDIPFGDTRVNLPEDIEMSKLFGQLVAEHFKSK